VLGDLQSGVLRADERKQILHEGAGAHVMTAYVEIHIENSDYRLPVEHDTVILKRSIGLKKDEYFLDRKHVTKTEVINLLESAGFSRSNPYNIVPQGKVMSLTTMKDEQRLELLKEVAGTRTYSERRTESIGIMEETSARRRKVDEMLEVIEKRLKELDAEKAELAEYQTLDKRRKVAEYTYYDKEQRKAREALQRMDSQRVDEVEKRQQHAQVEEEAKGAVAETEKSLAATSSEVKLLKGTVKSSSADYKQLLQQVAQLEMAAQQQGTDLEASTAAANEAKKELAQLSKQVKQVEAELAKVQPVVAEKAAEAARLKADEERAEAKLQQLYSRQTRSSQFKSKAERNKHLQKEVTAVKAALAKKEQQASNLAQQVERSKRDAGKSEEQVEVAKGRLAEYRKAEEAASRDCATHRTKHSKLTDTRKQLWRKEQELAESTKTRTADLDKAQRTLQQSMSRSLWESVQAVKRIAAEKQIGGVHGMLIELVDVDEKFYTAVETAASNQLFQVVVDTDDTAARMLSELQRANAGRVTFMPLNRLRPGNDPEYPVSEDVIPMLKKLKFDERFSPAFKQVFRKCLVVRNLEVGTRFSKSHDLDCVTLDGDQVNRKGALSGGYLDVRRSRLRAQADQLQLRAELTRAEQEVDKVTREGEKIDAEVTRVLGELRDAEDRQRKAAAAAEQEALELPGSSSAATSRAVDAQKEKALAALRAAADAERRRLEALEGEMASAFDAELSPEEEKRQQELQAQVKELTKACVKAERDAAKAEQQQARLDADLRENLLRRQRELQASIEEADEALSKGHGGGDVSAPLAAAQERLTATQTELAAAQQRHDEKRTTERQLKEALEGHKARLAAELQSQQDEAKELDRLLARRGVLAQKATEFADCIRKLGSLPKESFDESRRSLSSKQLMAEIEKCNKELQKLGHVNKKALDQFANFNDQRDKLLDRRKEVEKAEVSIRSLIEHLDHKKDEAMERTFKGVAKHFSEVFRELVPGGSGKLLMKTSQEGRQLDQDASAASRLATYQGISIRVQFAGGGDTQTMTQLSGGQKTMVALCLIFAIQRCDPAPFYIFDEIDANLDAAHRASLAQMIERQAGAVNAETGDAEPTQFITTTFRPELIHAGDQFYGVTHRNKASTIKTISKMDALRIIAEDVNRVRQHA